MISGIFAFYACNLKTPQLKMNTDPERTENTSTQKLVHEQE